MGGQVHDNQVVGKVLYTPKPPLAVTADKAYDRVSRSKMKAPCRSSRAVVMPRRRPIVPSVSTGAPSFYRRRHKIENYFCRIKDWRRIATRYDKLARNFLATAALVGALYWLRL
jgi:transposase